MKGTLLAVLCLFVVVAVAEQSWVSGENKNFAGKSIESIKKYLGWKKEARVELPVLQHAPTSIPAAFDAREQWANCTTIGTIQNQAECGSCWAFGAVEAITDRFCIHKGDDTQLSFQDMTSCDEYCDGCQGGDSSTAFLYAQKVGIVSAQCYPYTIPTCPPAQQPCLNFVNTPVCQTTCNDTSINWAKDKRVLTKVYHVASRDNGIETEIMTNGPVEACFDVYEDFLSYKSGVYVHTNGTLLGGHCVKLLGWGTTTASPPVRYWIVANSWTDTWGNNGYFWIKRGDNQCGIEDDVAAGLP